jgi:threonine synthase
MMKKIRYYSTNRNLDGVEGIVPFKGYVSFKDALLQGQAPDEGLFMPDFIPGLSLDDIMALKGKPYSEVAMLVTGVFLGDEISQEALKKIVYDSYNCDVPLE